MSFFFGEKSKTSFFDKSSAYEARFAAVETDHEPLLWLGDPKLTRDRELCADLRATHAIEWPHSLATLTPETQRQWAALRCPELLGGETRFEHEGVCRSDVNAASRRTAE